MPIQIEQNTFAHACYEQNSVEELRNALLGEADPADMTEWDISAGEWREQIQIALAARLADGA